ncbi:protein-S-isoprenylcysteine O-methyltransferase isoform X1 [Maniola hyperantus]|uniref:protein-S-isoprenylcysteine O-methyltransferase isoform X1 n=1 Tax=Aphantopus hyperantus TaxID=2795564 RepID=UPI0015699E97|nr:protein-S-isoprenylcysteine O-methyltransferase isoform X1 [Maniola hyperantus]
MMRNASPAAAQAMLCFSLSCLVFTVSLFSSSVLGFTSELWALTYWGPGLYFCLLNFVLRYSLKGFTYDVAVRSAFLGSAFATGLYFATFDSYHIFGLYAMAFSMFHFSEFLSVALTNPRTLTVDSFILNHSVQYWVAAVSSWVEAAVENYFFPGMKTVFWLSHIGVVLCIGGEVMRKLAMFTAKTNFNHHVQTVKSPDHRLVTHGVYRVCRHPSYVGWFYWSIGTQLILLNPICVLIYTLVSWSFFRERIFAEEMFLISFFGSQYLDYQKKVGTGLPFIRGYLPDGTGAW